MPSEQFQRPVNDEDTHDAGGASERQYEPGVRVSLVSGAPLILALAAMLVLAWRPAWWPGMVGAAFAATGLLVRAWRRRAFSAGQVLVLALLLRLLFVALPPVLSDDGFRYVWDGVVQVEERSSPYRYAPAAPALAELHDESVYARLNSASYHSVYPPASQLVFAAGGLLYDAFGWQTSFYLINALFALMEGALVWLLYRQGAGARALLLYALHPLVLLEAAGQGHTEAGAALFLVLTVLWARAGRGRAASVALALAALFKLYPIVLFPFLWWRFGAKALWPATLAGVLFCLPYAGGVDFAGVWASLDLYVRFFEFNAGPYYALKGLMSLFTGADWSKTLGPALRWLFLAGLPALYWLDFRRQWSRHWTMAKAFFWTVALYLLCATTVHPWYLVPLLALAALRHSQPEEKPSWPWQWLALCSLGTYLLYAPIPGAEAWYGAFVAMGWAGAAVLAVWQHREALVRPLLRWRASRKARRVASLLPEADRRQSGSQRRLLDLGAGEGFVGAALRQRLRAKVVLADVGDFNRTDLAHHVYDGQHLPFADDAFDTVVLYFVLHHAEVPEAVLHEALRVARGRVVIAESVYRGAWQRRLLRFWDRQANRLRCGGTMGEGPLHLRRAEEWRALIQRLGGRIVEERQRGPWMHRQAFFAVAPAEKG